MIISTVNVYLLNSYSKSRLGLNRTCFKSGVNEQKTLCNKILQAGYKFFEEVDLINPQGKNIKGLAFVRDNINAADKTVKILITDNKYFELGDVSASLCATDPTVIWCSVKNQTTLKPQMSPEWMKSEFLTLSNTFGHYRHVCSQAYTVLEKYLKDNYPNIKKLKIQAENSDSFDFHIKCGFGDSSMLGEYDYCSMTNILDKNL